MLGHQAGGDRFLFIADLDARTTAADLFRKLLPPRLAKVTDLTDEWQVYRVFGGGAAAPPIDVDGIVVAQAPLASPFTALVAGTADAIAHALKVLAIAGARTATDDEWEAARILAGWARRGAEIDEKTLVQEVRFDENGGVSYEKGCYTGQETVARLHFRGHTNRDLRGLTWSGTEPLTDAKIMVGEKEVGSVRSILTLPTGRFALALIRREVETGQVVTAGGLPATVVRPALRLPKQSASAPSCSLGVLRVAPSARRFGQPVALPPGPSPRGPSQPSHPSRCRQRAPPCPPLHPPPRQPPQPTYPPASCHRPQPQPPRPPSGTSALLELLEVE